jgi:hypothetical protein
MPEQEQYELQTRNAFVERIVELDELEEALRGSAANPRPAPPPLKDVMKKVADALHESEHVIDDHASGTIRVSDDLLQLAAHVVRSAKNVVTAVVLIEAVRPLRP